MCYRARRFDRPEDRAAQARGLLDFMARSASPIDRINGALLGEEAEYIRQRPDSYLLHDHLEEVNDPVYFHEFMGRAAAKGLRFVSEVQSSVLALEGLPPPVADGLRRLAADDVELEQFLDFLINRRFRLSVLCHADLTPRRAAHPEDLAQLDVAAAKADPPLPVPMRNEGLLRGALAHLAGVWPLGIPWVSLPRSARARIEPASRVDAASQSRDEQDLAADLIRRYNLKLVEFRTYRPPYVLEISDKPLASSLARHQASVRNTVTNLRHEAGQLNDFSRIVLRHLDGTNDRSAILRALDQSRNEGRLVIPSPPVSPGDGAPGDHRDELLERLYGPMLDGCLERLSRFALLMN
ncbi:MAG: Methyltransferase regulatory protein [Planctomycetota bacterium]|nr:Methyltransferase regulatory protein [Planctomycetota bacterium]